MEMRKTERGFPIGEFTDIYGTKCSLQMSSLAEKSAIWFGVDNAKPQILKSKAVELGLEVPEGEVSGWMDYPFPEDVHFTTRMHLDQATLEQIFPALRVFLMNGCLYKPEESTEDLIKEDDWFHTQPQEEGWYWSYDENDVVFPVLIECVDEAGGIFTYEANGQRGDFECDCWTNFMRGFAGPISNVPKPPMSL